MTVLRTYEALLIQLQQRPRHGESLLVAVDRCGGSGKSTFARSLQQLDPSISIVHIDDFYLPSAQRPPIHQSIAAEYDIERLSADVLAPLIRNQPACYQRYDWGADRLAEFHTIPSGGIVIIEGVYTLVPKVEDAYDYKVWVECPYDLRLARGVARDGEVARSWWVDHWMPAEQHYIATCSPAARADLVVDGSFERDREFAALG